MPKQEDDALELTLARHLLVLVQPDRAGLHARAVRPPRTTSRPEERIEIGMRLAHNL
jgi:hypothetical protein